MDTKLAHKKISSYIIQSQEDEIKRIALELHEGVGQTLYSLYTGMQLIQSSVEEETMKGYIGGMAELLEKTIQEVRLLSVELHPPTLTTLGLMPAIKSYLKLYTSTYGIEVNLTSIGNELSISERERITLFRVCQEALANIARYADIVTAEMTFIWSPNALRVQIKDEGKGFDKEIGMSQSSGLAAMKERMHLIGGEWTISTSIGAGTLIELYLPIK